MSSNVFFKFTSQKDPSRVTFDGTSISVWELKRDIITQSGLGDGTDFDLILTDPNTNEEYDDDTTQIQRSTSVTAKRARPSQGPGRGKAARYLTGKMPTMTKAAPKSEPSLATAASSMPSGGTEEENIAAMLKQGGMQWEQEKARMADAPKVARTGGPKRPPQNNNQNSDKEPPHGYVCHRCRKPGHWIQNCPTNNDASYDNGPRVKRTTGIPRSFLRTVQDEPESTGDGMTEEKKVPTNIMVNAEGQRVEAIPDFKSWEQYRAKAEASAAKKEEAVADSKELEERGLACPVDKRLYVNPHKTPCCGRTYCHECIEDALMDSDFACPNCGEQALIEDLEADEDMVKKIKEYQDEKTAKAKAAEVKKSESPPPAAIKGSNSPPGSSSNPKKRAAEDELVSARQKTKSPPGSTPRSPVNGVKSPVKSPSQKPASPVNAKPVPTGPKADQNFEQQMNELAKQHGFNPNQMNNMQMPNGFNPFGMPSMGGMNPMMLQMMQNGMNPMMGMMGMPNTPNMGMMPGNGGMGGMNFNQQNGTGMGGGWNGNTNTNNANNMNNNPGMAGVPTGPKAHRMPQFAHQQASRGGEDDAYMRKPLNPHRAAHRNRRARPMDFKEL